MITDSSFFYKGWYCNFFPLLTQKRKNIPKGNVYGLSYESSSRRPCLPRNFWNSTALKEKQPTDKQCCKFPLISGISGHCVLKATVMYPVLTSIGKEVNLPLQPNALSGCPPCSSSRELESMEISYTVFFSLAQCCLANLLIFLLNWPPGWGVFRTYWPELFHFKLRSALLNAAFTCNFMYSIEHFICSSRRQRLFPATSSIARTNQ